MTETSCRAPNTIKVLQTSIKHAVERYDVMLVTDAEMEKSMKTEKRNILSEFLRIYELDFRLGVLLLNSPGKKPGIQIRLCLYQRILSCSMNGVMI